MNMIVFGATGPTGRELVKQGLELGRDVTAFVRNASALDLKDTRPLVVKGDVTEPTPSSPRWPGRTRWCRCWGRTVARMRFARGLAPPIRHRQRRSQQQSHDQTLQPPRSSRHRVHSTSAGSRSLRAGTHRLP